MAIRYPLYVANGSAGVTPPQDARLAQSGELSTGAGSTGIDVGAGIVYGPGSPMAVTGSTSGPNMQYNVAAGFVATQRGTAADGVYRFANDGTTLVSSGSAAPSSGTRYDLIWVRAKNANDGFGDADSTPVFGVTVGTASGSPSKPTGSVPAGALILAESLVGTSIANASLATITMVAPYKVSRGAPVPVRSSTERDALSAHDGLSVYRIDRHAREWYDGTSWLGLVQSYSPAWAGLTVSNGTVTAQYQMLGDKQMWWRVTLVFGSGTSVSAGIAVALPSGVTSDGAEQDVDLKIAYAGGASSVKGFMNIPASSTVAYPYGPTATSTNVLAQLGTFGQTFGAGSNLVASGVIRLA